MNTTLKVVRYELQNVLRNRYVLAYAIFFLVTTVFSEERGLGIVLPERQQEEIEINPKNIVTSYLWSNNRVKRWTDGSGKRSNFSHASLTNHTLGLERIVDAEGGIFTFTYDSTTSRLIRFSGGIGSVLVTTTCSSTELSSRRSASGATALPIEVFTSSSISRIRS